ncbi:double zinc ribbon domain-containing protein [Lacisediminihabitans profunda]|uniref:FHA domain-containing protein n=1 Tax=Lacisediminihabitans profunda TaxID=2594790 RepID=A0A5C8UM25_9MICO|nr:zinc ribbon domain-containing protein [Lacisediminihabitans profunda]TXN28520.1 FHA domain-containing protein [Lacisediminihabitans profunda]
MRCTYCGTELPVGALFCGECGRAVAQSQLPTGRLPRVQTPAVRTDVLGESSRPVAQPLVTPGSVLLCEQCGSLMAADDIFCGECGNVSRAVSDTFSRPRDTVVIDRIERVEAREMPVAREPDPAPPAVDVLPVAEALAPAEQSTPEQSSSGRESAGTPTPPTDAVAGPVAPTPSPQADAGDVEATRIVRRENGVRFVLQFSTGESFTVYGTGLIGRNPKVEPGEYVDQLVRVLDPSRSVSKTHLEFGQDDGSFWIVDRFSGNGTIVREPDSAPVRCEPNKRHRIMRGTRVEIGEQFFIVS